MAQYKTNSCGFKPVFEGPSTVEEYDQLAGYSGAALEDAVYNTIYRDTLPKWQAEFAPKLEAITGERRRVDEKRTERARARAKDPSAVEDVLETFKSFATRAVAAYLNVTEGTEEEIKAEIARRTAELNEAAQMCANNIKVDPSPSVRAASINKGWLDKADDILSRDDAAIDAAVAKLTAVVPEFVLERDENDKPERRSLARLVGAYLDAQLAV